MYYKSEVRIESMGEYIEEIKRIRKRVSCDSQGEYLQWYRGQADITWNLEPKIQRDFYGNEEELFRKERFYTNDFQSRASLLKFPKPSIDDYANWLTIMQHYGLPTRLLDWSQSPLIALYFAVSDEKACEKDACIWVLTPGKLNEEEKLEKSSIVNEREYKNTFIYNMAHKTIYTMIYTAFRRWELSENPKAITQSDIKFDYRFNSLCKKIAACYPIEADGRVYNQYSAFTVHNTLKKLTDFCDDLTLALIMIPKEKKKDFLYELQILGMTQSYIFPDFEHLANELKNKKIE